MSSCQKDGRTIIPHLAVCWQVPQADKKCRGRRQLPPATDRSLHLRTLLIGGDDRLHHRQMTDKQLAAAGIPAGLVRMSCGLESKQDLIGDIAQALDQVK